MLERLGFRDAVSVVRPGELAASLVPARAGGLLWLLMRQALLRRAGCAHGGGAELLAWANARAAGVSGIRIARFDDTRLHNGALPSLPATPSGCNPKWPRLQPYDVARAATLRTRAATLCIGRRLPAATAARGSARGGSSRGDPPRLDAGMHATHTTQAVRAPVHLPCKYLCSMQAQAQANAQLAVRAARSALARPHAPSRATAAERGLSNETVLAEWQACNHTWQRL